jgi:hypothetical protein
VLRETVKTIARSFTTPKNRAAIRSAEVFEWGMNEVDPYRDGITGQTT